VCESSNPTKQADTAPGRRCPENKARAAAVLVFHGELKTLLRRPRRAGPVAYPVDRRASIKDVVESLGVPHTEIYGLQCNGRQAGLEDILAPGQRLEIHPAVPPVEPLRDHPLRPALPRLAFLVDENVARLAGLLRLVGLDAAYDRELGDKDLARLAHEEGRILLTRDTALLKRSLVTHGRLVRAAEPWDQLREILTFYRTASLRLLSRCPRCNQLLAPVDKQDVLPLLEPKTKRYYRTFHQCPGCGRVYWRGSHVEKLMRRLSKYGLHAKLENPDDNPYEG